MDVSELLQNRQMAYIDSSAMVRAGIGGISAFVGDVADAYRALEKGDASLPTSEYLKYPDRPSYDRIITLLGHLGGKFQVSGVKQICSGVRNFEKGFPRASGLIILNDVETNRPIAILEAGQISAVRTAVVSAIAIDHLATDDMAVIAIIGCGQLGTTHIEMLADVFGPARFELLLFDLDPTRAETACNIARGKGFTCSRAGSAEAAIRMAQIVIPATTSEEPYIQRSWLQQHALYCAVSLLDAHLDLYAEADLIVVDDLKTCLAENRPLERLARENALPREKIASIGSIISAREVGRERRNLTIFNPMGTVITDLAVAWRVLQNSLRDSSPVLLSI